MNILFLVEKDVKLMNVSKDYQIQNFQTVTTLKKSNEDKIRVLCLIDENVKNVAKTREDLMSEDFPSIWIEITSQFNKNFLICGFYREWNRNGLCSAQDQLQRLKILTEQMKTATEENKIVIMLGDANLCSQQWENKEYTHFHVAAELRGMLSQCGMENCQIGNTYMADRLREDGTVIESAIDHIYINQADNLDMKVKKLPISATDHLPIVVEVATKVKKKTLPMKVTKRSMKNFTQANWNECLSEQEWEKLGLTEDPNEMAKHFNDNIIQALDKCAPKRIIKVHLAHKFGLSEKTKTLIAERDKLRKNLHKLSPNERKIAHIKYKKARNLVTNQIRKDTKAYNEERIKKADDQKEMWNVVNEVIAPRVKSQWELNEDGLMIKEELEIANTFNKFFVSKIQNLRTNINQNYVEDPLEKLRKKMVKKNIKFSLKTVSEKKVYKAICSLKRKKSSGSDGLTQEQLVLGAKTIAVPLTRIINSSISSGIFPEEWKEAIISPILKKGDPTKKENYRPVSCLPVAAKVLEMIVNEQVSHFMETNNLLPQNQHGFRPKRSTMSALSAMQEEWTRNTENKLKTGVLLWDLSAAYDMVNPSLFCEKAKLYGFDELTCKWFLSFLTGRSQRVKVGEALSERLETDVGVPQGGILSPLIFVIYGSDLEDWIEHCTAFTYADDTSTSCCGKTDEEVIKKLEEDAECVLKFMASNGLVANPTKTVFMILNSKNQSKVPRIVKIGSSEVTESANSKLLGIVVGSDQKWKEHVYGKGGVVSTLNQRLFIIRRLANHLSTPKLIKVAQSIWMSKLRYGLQLFSEVRMHEEQSKSMDMQVMQVAQNKLLRVLTGTKKLDCRKIEDLLKEVKMMSVNQTAAQIKLTEMWKAVHDNSYPIKVQMKSSQEKGMSTRSCTRGQVVEVGSSTKRIKSFIGSASRLWNVAPEKIKNASTIWMAKAEIKKFCLSLPF